MQKKSAKKENLQLINIQLTNNKLITIWKLSKNGAAICYCYSLMLLIDKIKVKVLAIFV